MIKTITATIFAAGLLGACTGGTIPNPVVSDYNGDSVRIQLTSAYMYLNKEQKAVQRQQAQTEASIICRTGHRKKAKYVSQRFISTSQYSGYPEFLYLCLN